MKDAKPPAPDEIPKRRPIREVLTSWFWFFAEAAAILLLFNAIMPNYLFGVGAFIIWKISGVKDAVLRRLENVVHRRIFQVIKFVADVCSWVFVLFSRLVMYLIASVFYILIYGFLVVVLYQVLRLLWMLYQKRQ